MNFIRAYFLVLPAILSLVYSFSPPHRALMSTQITMLVSKSAVLQGESVQTSSRVFVGNLPFSITEGNLSGLVNKLVGPGQIKEVKIAKGSKTQRPLGFAFIEMTDAFAAERAVSALDGYDWDGRILNSNVKPLEESGGGKKGKKKDVFEHSRSIFLRNLDFSLSEDEIFNMCDDLVGEGLVSKVKIALDKETGRPRGFAYIEFKEEPSVDIAIRELTNVEVLGLLLKAERMLPEAPKRRDGGVRRNL